LTTVSLTTQAAEAAPALPRTRARTRAEAVKVLEMLMSLFLPDFGARRCCLVPGCRRRQLNGSGSRRAASLQVGRGGDSRAAARRPRPAAHGILPGGGSVVVVVEARRDQELEGGDRELGAGADQLAAAHPAELVAVLADEAPA